MNLSGIGVDKGIGIDVYRVMPFFFILSECIQGDAE